MPSIGDSLELTPKDLNKFNKKMTDEILDAQKNGWRGHVNRQGHVSMLAPDGKDTVVVSANSNAINQLSLGINRYRRRMGETVGVEAEKPKEKVAQRWPCARPACPKVYATEEQLNLHIAVDHEKRIKCPDCNETFKAANVVGRHRQLKHGYESPHKKKRLEQEAKRAKKKLNEEGKLTEEQRKSVNDYVAGTSPLIDDHIRRHAGETVEIVLNAGAEAAREAGESTGRDIKSLINGEGHNGAKFDPHFVHRMVANAPSEPIMDTIPAVDLTTPKEGSLKGYFQHMSDQPIIRDRQDVVDGVIKDVLEGKLPNGYSDELPLEVLDSDEVFQLQDMKEEDRAAAIDKIHQFNSINSTMSVADIYRETAAQLKRATEAIKKPQGLTLDLEQIMDMDIRSVARVLKAAGMSLKLSSVPNKEE